MSKLSKSSKSIHKKWQMEAEAKGGKGAKVIVVQSEAKKVIFNLLKDSFRPMNITSIYEALKATVPSPLLKTCLESMSISATNDDDQKRHDDESDDDVFVKKPNSPKNKVAKDEYSGTIIQKTGRNANTTLYTMNQQHLRNEGNAMNPDERNELVSLLQNEQVNLQTLTKSVQDINTKTDLLSSQPFNDEIGHLLPQQEDKVQNLTKQIESAKKLKVDEKDMKKTQRKIEKMASHWRKSKSKCIDFLNMMEDCTEGTVSAKKCLSGNGQIDIESDDMIVKQAKAVYSNRNNNPNKRRKVMVGNHCNVVASKRNESDNEVQALESFIAVKLGPNNKIQRIIVEGN